jgi:hypothetical protein
VIPHAAYINKNPGGNTMANNRSIELANKRIERMEEKPASYFRQLLDKRKNEQDQSRVALNAKLVEILPAELGNKITDTNFTKELDVCRVVVEVELLDNIIIEFKRIGQPGSYSWDVNQVFVSKIELSPWGQKQEAAFSSFEDAAYNALTRE